MDCICLLKFYPRRASNAKNHIRIEKNEIYDIMHAHGTIT